MLPCLSPVSGRRWLVIEQAGGKNCPPIGSPPEELRERQREVVHWKSDHDAIHEKTLITVAPPRRLGVSFRPRAEPCIVRAW